MAYELVPNPGRLVRRVGADEELLRAFGVRAGRVTPLDADLASTREFSHDGSGGLELLLLFFARPYRGQLFATTCSPHSRGERGYVDLLNPAAVDWFVENTHERYKERVGDHFGATIKAFFVDEPANYQGFPYTPALFREFEERKGYDLRDRLYQLVLPVGDFGRVRHDYREVVTSLYVAAFRKLAGWCEANGLALTGHLLQEEALHKVPENHGDVYGPLAQMGVPGVDYLSDVVGWKRKVPTCESPTFALKLASSVAHAHRREGSLVEIFGGCGWGTAPAKLKRVAWWVQVLGVSKINVHAAFQSVLGLRKRDFPASHFVQEPWWEV
ncbi:MAG: hypothetical protein Kow0069_35360 [Promethearchaeota archaeon]